MGRDNYYVYFTDEKTEALEVKEFAHVTQMVINIIRVKILVIGSRTDTCSHYTTKPLTVYSLVREQHSIIQT